MKTPKESTSRNEGASCRQDSFQSSDSSSELLFPSHMSKASPIILRQSTHCGIVQL